MPILETKDLLEVAPSEGVLAYTESAVVRSEATSSSIIPFGRFVTYVTGSDGVVELGTSAGVLAGVSLAINSIERRDGYSINANGEFGYPAQHPIGIVRRGVIWVKVTTACVVGGQVFRIHTPGAGEQAGQVRNDNTGAVLVPNAEFLETLPAAGLVKIAINLA